MSQGFLCFGQRLCETCTKTDLEARTKAGENVSEDSVARLADPTVCSQCNMDNGSIELETVLGQPLCEACRESVSVRFPMWIKVAFVGLLVLAGYSLVRNARFFMAHREAKQAVAASKDGDADQAYALMEKSYGRVPESTELGAMRDLFWAIKLVHDRKDQEAKEALKALKAAFPNDPLVDDLLLHVEGSLAFDAQDYDRFLEIELKRLKASPENETAISWVASAHACKFAVTGAEKHRMEAMRLMEKLEKKAGQEEWFVDFKARMLHRMDSREIITKEEYEKRFGKEPKE